MTSKRLNIKLSAARIKNIGKLKDSDCRHCSLYKSAQSVCTMGQGNPLSPLMVLGEAPGKREDDLEKPFQGKAGQFLRACMERQSINPDKVWIDNPVRCRPPENRKPTDQEIEACEPYLEEVIRIIKPRVVLALGSTALWAMTKKVGITAQRGNKIWSSKWGCLVVPAFHPAYVLRNMSVVSTFHQDILLARHSLGVFRDEVF